MTHPIQGNELPAHLVSTCFLAHVPASSYRTAANDGDYMEFNVAAWLGFRFPPTGPVGILVQYQDAGGRHTLIVDECLDVDGLQLMLSGKVQVQAVGAIDRMSVLCSGIEDGHSVRVDELFVQKVQASAALARRSKIAANGNS